MQKPRLLVVDDEADMLDFLERVFRADYVVTAVRSVDEARAALAREHFDVLVTDHMMPHATGLELLESIRVSYPGLARVLLSGYTDLAEVERAVARCDVDAHVVKPVDSTQLRAEVATARARAGARTQRG